MFFSAISNAVLYSLCIAIGLSYADIQNNFHDILGVAQEASQKQIDQAFAKLSQQFQAGSTWKDQMDRTMDDVTKAYEALKDKGMGYKNKGEFPQTDHGDHDDLHQEEKSSSTQRSKTVSSSSYAHSSSSYKDGEEPVMHFSSGGSHEGGECTTVTTKNGNSVSTQTTCKTSDKDEL